MKRPDDKTARARTVEAMKSRKRALTTPEIADLTDRITPSALGTLNSLKAEGIVKRERPEPGTYRREGKVPWLWSLTGKPLPEQFANPAKADRERVATGRPPEAPRFDHRALAAVLGMDVTPPPAPANARYIQRGIF